jgi:hypothetical protein
MYSKQQIRLSRLSRLSHLGQDVKDAKDENFPKTTHLSELGSVVLSTSKMPGVLLKLVLKMIKNPPKI